MSTNAQSEALENAGRFYEMLKSLHEFDKAEIFGVINTLLSISEEDSCFIGTYYRARGNVETLLEIENAKHFQAVAMLSRALFELAVDIRLLDKTPLGFRKMIVAGEVEKLRCARKIIAFKASNPTANVDTAAYDSFVTNRAQEIERKKGILWPNKQKIEHWSGLNLRERVALLKAPFEQIYEVEYPSLSWYVHPGLTGVVNLKPETFTFICSNGFKLAADAYWEVLHVVIRQYKMDLVDEKIENKMKAARMLPFTDSPNQAEELLQELLR